MSFSVVSDIAFENDIESILRLEHHVPQILTYEVILNTPTLDFPIPLLESIEVLRDYINNITDYIMVDFKIGMGDYIYDILPNNENLEMTVKLKYYQYSVIIRYKFIIMNIANNTTASVYGNMPQQDLNESTLMHVEGQLLDRSVEVLRTTISDGVYNYTTVGDIIKTTFSEKLNEVLVEGSRIDYRLSIEPPENTNIYRHIDIEYGTNIFDIPTYLQETAYGVYNGGIGTYHQRFDNTLIVDNKVQNKDGIFIAPLYNSTRFESDTGKKLMILAYPTNKYKYSEYTFSVDGDIVKIVISGMITNLDDGENSALDEGVSIVSSNPNYITGVNKDITDDSVDNFLPGNNKPPKGLIKRDLRTKSDSVYKHTYVKSPDNMFKHNSRVIARGYTIFQVQWNYSNPELLYPYMPVKFIYRDKENGLVSVTGTLTSCFYKYNNATKNITTILNLTVEKPRPGTSDSNVYNLV